jgi:hypothetical protein
MADNIMVPQPNPVSIQTIQEQQTLPEFYTNYLQDVANLGTGAIQQGGVAGFSPLQQQAFQMAPNAAFSGAQTAGNAASLLGASGTTAAPSLVGGYMNPYTTNVVDEMARLQNQNIQRSVLPALRGAGVGTGSFGSTRQANATGQTLAEMQRNLTGQQYNALYSGYGDAMKAAQTDLNRQMQAGQGLGNVATEQYNIGTGGLKTLSDLGAQQQALGQKQLDYPMIQAQNLAKLFPMTVPTGKTTQTVAPTDIKQLAPSPLSQIGSLLSSVGSIINRPQSAFGQPTTTQGGTQQTNRFQQIFDAFGIPETARSILEPMISPYLQFKDGGTVKGVPKNFQNYLKHKAKRNS